MCPSDEQGPVVDIDQVIDAWDSYASTVDFRGNAPMFSASDVHRWLENERRCALMRPRPSELAVTAVRRPKVLFPGRDNR